MQTIYSEFLGSISSFHLIELCGPFGRLVGQIFAIGHNDQGKLVCVLCRATALPGLHNTSLWLVIEAEKVSSARLIADRYVPRPGDSVGRPRLYKEDYSLNF